MKNRYAILILCALLLLAFLTGCSQKTDADITPITVTTPEPTKTLPPEPTPEPLESDGIASVTEMTPETEYQIDIDADGVADSVKISSVYDEKTYMTDTIIAINGKETMMEELNFIEKAYCVVLNDGTAGIIYSGDYMSSDYVTKACLIQNGVPVQTSEVYGMLTGIDGKHLMFECIVDVLGTWFCSIDYNLDTAAFSMQPAEGAIYAIGNHEYTDLITIRDLPVMILDFDTDTYSPKTLPKNTILTPLYTDGKEIFGFETDEGEAGYIEFTRSDYQIYINGILEDEYFSELHYSG